MLLSVWQLNLCSCFVLIILILFEMNLVIFCKLNLLIVINHDLKQIQSLLNKSINRYLVLNESSYNELFLCVLNGRITLQK